MRNIILIPFLLSLNLFVLADEISLDEIKSDFRETINYYDYNLTEQSDSQISSPQRIRNNETTAEIDNEILNLESEFSGSASDEVKVQASGIEKPAPRLKRSR